MGHRFPRINQTVLTAFLLVSLPALIAGVVLVLLLGQARMREFYGNHLTHVAEQMASVVDAYVYRKILDVSLLGRSPEVREGAAAGSRQPFEREKVRALDALWQKDRQVPTALAGIFDTRASKFFADVVGHDQVYRELLLTDRQGRLIAGSNRSSDYDQSDEDWWKAAFDDGVRGRVAVTDVRWDESARALALEVAVPVLEPDSDRLAGVMKAVVDARELLASVAGLQPGATGQATLLRNDGTIVFSRATLEPNARFFATQPLTESLARLRDSEGQGDRRVHFRATTADGERQIVGVAPSQLGRSYSNISWLVAVSQAESEFLAPMRTVGWYLAALFAVATILVLMVALWFSMRLSAPVVDVAMDLVDHGRVSRMPDTGDEEDDELPRRRAAGR